MQSMKETAANIAASAKAGVEKTKATVQEKVEKMQAHSPMEKAMATEKKEERLTQAEINKLETMKHNAAARHSPKGGASDPVFTGTSPTGVDNSYITLGATTSPTGTASYSTIGEHGWSTRGHQMSAMPGHGTGQPMGGHVVEGLVDSHPIGWNSGTGRTMAHNTRAGANPSGPYDSTGVDNSYITPSATINPTGTASYSTTGEHGLSTGGHQMSAMPGHGTGQPAGGHVVEGVVESHPIGMNSGTGRTMAHNTKAGGNPPGPYHGTGGSYS
ncbi:18 kDa seed maturation protein-like [Pistacia vera]|uniref:18 kDa seed maturation protein-like n=1 Tax=Pistacia vera TaxID=55513 RepID=UPI0012637C9D|nr:18 kDa seed maturation protein-like [Pistacia vera]